MPRPPPAMPLLFDATGAGVEATVAGRAAPGGGSCALSTRPTGAVCAGLTEPVASPAPVRCDAQKPSLRRLVSLHPAVPTAISVSAIAAMPGKRAIDSVDIASIASRQVVELACFARDGIGFFEISDIGEYDTDRIATFDESGRLVPVRNRESEENGIAGGKRLSLI